MNNLMENGNCRGRDLLILAVLLALLFGFKLGDRALWSPEEGHYSEIAREMVVSGDYLTPRLAGIKFLEKPPLFFWLESANIGLFGLSEWSVRLWPTIFAVAGCLAVYCAGSRLFGRRVGLISSAVLATSGLWYAMGHVISLDMAVSAFISCSLLSFLVGSVETSAHKRRFAMWAFFIFSALATMTKGLIGIVIPAMVIGTWILILNDWNILTTIYLPSGVSLFLLMAAPWHVLISRDNPGFLTFYLMHEHFQRYLTKPEGAFQQPWAYIPVLLLGMFPWPVFMLQALRYNLRFPRRQLHQHKEVIFLVLWAGLVFLFFSGSSYKVIPYILPMLPPLAILIARYLAAAWESPHLSGLQSGSFTLLVSLLVIACLTGPQHYLERYSNWPSLNVPRAEATIVSTSVKEYGDLSSLTPYIHAQAAILVVGVFSALTLVFGNRAAFRLGLLSLTLAWALFLVALNSSLPLLDQRRSVKDLAAVLKVQLRPSDEVVSYHAYYQDLPVYLQRPVAVVGWKGDLQFGVEVDEHSGGWMIDDATFWKRWNSRATVYMLTEETTYEKLRSDSSLKFRVLAQGLYDVLLSNKYDIAVR